MCVAAISVHSLASTRRLSRSFSWRPRGEMQSTLYIRQRSKSCADRCSLPLFQPHISTGTASIPQLFATLSLRCCASVMQTLTLLHCHSCCCWALSVFKRQRSFDFLILLSLSFSPSLLTHSLTHSLAHSLFIHLNGIDAYCVCIL